MSTMKKHFTVTLALAASLTSALAQTPASAPANRSSQPNHLIGYPTFEPLNGGGGDD